MNTQFQIQFTSDAGIRKFQIQPEDLKIEERSMAYYQVYMDNTYLFSICPVITLEGMNWELIEKERAQYLPAGFVTFLGNRIDDYYLN
jgi:hypothetical protein